MKNILIFVFVSSFTSLPTAIGGKVGILLDFLSSSSSSSSENQSSYLFVLTLNFFSFYRLYVYSSYLYIFLAAYYMN